MYNKDKNRGAFCLKKRKESKLKFSRILLVLLIVVFLAYVSIRFTIGLIDKNLGKNIASSFSSVLSSTPKYEIIKEDINENYAGKRKRESPSEKTGYATTFTTIDKNKKIYLEYKQNGNSSWSQKEYWDNNMETSRMWYYSNVYYS